MSEYKLDKYHNIKVFTQSGNIYYIYANRLSNHKLHNFNNWLCNSGSDSLFVSFTGEIFNGQCLNNKLGTIDNFEIFDEAIVCKKSRCSGCTTDLSMEKYLNE